MNVEIKNLSKAYGEKQVLRGFNASFAENKTTLIMGDSGCGKTTLLRIMMGLEKADSGEISGVDPRSISAVFQEDRLCEDFTAVSNIAMVLEKTRENTEEIERHLELVGLGDAMYKPVRELSGGMKRRVAIVRAVLVKAKLFLLDEPLKGLDEHNKKQVAEYIKMHEKGMNERGVTTIMVTHDFEEVEMMGAELLRMHKI